MFTTNHFIWIAICVVFIVTLLVLSIKFKFSFKVATYIVCGISLASELCKIFTHMTETSSTGMVLEAGALPFHLCSLLIFVFLFLAFSKNENLRNKIVSFVVPVSIAGGVLAILMATSGVDFTEPYSYQCFVYHAGILWYALYLICSKQVDLGLKAYIRNLCILMFLVVIMLWVNSALQSYDVNFFYLVRPPVKNLPLLNLNHGWYVYFITVLLCGLLLLTIIHLPSIITQIVKNYKQNKQLKGTE